MVVLEKSVFRKSSKHRNEPVRMGHVYSDIEDEYRALEKLHGLMPELVAEPVDLYENDDGFMEYSMERVEGELLYSYLDDQSPEESDQLDISRVAEQLERIEETIERSRYPHGDLHSGNNIIVRPDSRIKLVDPVGYPEDFSKAYGERAPECLERALLEDTCDLQVIREELS